MKSSFQKNSKIGIVGLGNLGQAILQSLIQSARIEPNQIYCSNRSPGKLIKAKEVYGVNTFQNNEEVVEACDVVIIGVKPQDLSTAIEPLRHAFRSDQVVVSTAAAIPCEELQHMVGDDIPIARIAANTPLQIGRGVIGLYISESATIYGEPLIELFDHFGSLFVVEEEEQLSSILVAAGCGTGFILEFMIYWQEWLEAQGFSNEEARRMTVDIFTGSSLLAEKRPSLGLQDLLNQVTSKGGMTAAGLQSIRQFEMDRTVRLSFEKAAEREKEIQKKFEESYIKN